MNESKNALIIGNGFDLDLGLSTRFSDFAKSKFWPEDNGSQLSAFLAKKLDINEWFDLEHSLYDYICGPEASWRKHETIDKDLEYFKLLQSNLMQFIGDQEKENLDANSTAAKLIKVVSENGLFDYIYTLNYTDLNRIAERLGGYKLKQSFHLHGSVKDKNAIIGIGNYRIRADYTNWRKVRNEYYRSNNIFGDLDIAKEIVFFGVSFGSIDSSYFEPFFSKISRPAEEPIKDKDRKVITIFTLDEKGRTFILDCIEQMKVNLNYLFNQTDFEIIRTGEKKDSVKIEKCLTRIRNGKPFLPFPKAMI